MDEPPVVAVAISGWDDAELLRGCLESVAAAGLPALYLDGAYLTYPVRVWQTHPVLLSEAVDGFERVRVVVPGERPIDEASKRGALLAETFAEYGGGDELAWALVLDCDERLEAEPGAIEAYLAEHAAGCWWATLNIYRPDIPGARAGFQIPRLIREGPGLHCRGPRDFDVYRYDQRIAYHWGERVPAKLAHRHVALPESVARIRHDRHLRTPERVELSGTYMRQRRERDGVP